jgi:hypothetical protein
MVKPGEASKSFNLPNREIIIRYDEEDGSTPDFEIRIIDDVEQIVPIIRPAAGSKPPETVKEATTLTPVISSVKPPKSNTEDDGSDIIDQRLIETLAPPPPTPPPAEEKAVIEPKPKTGSWKSSLFRGLKYGLAAAGLMAATVFGVQKMHCENTDTTDQNATASLTGNDGGPGDAGDDVNVKTNDNRTAQTPANAAKPPQTKTGADTGMGVKMKINEAKIPTDQVMARRFLETGKYPEGMNQSDHLSKSLFIFGQNLTNAEIVQVNKLISDYNVGEYAHNLNAYKGKGPKDIKDIDPAIRGQARKDLTHALLKNTESYRNNFVEKHRNEMELYEQCASEFSKAGMYGSQGTIGGNLTTFAARLMMIRGWGSALNSDTTNTTTDDAGVNTGVPGTTSPGVTTPGATTPTPTNNNPVDFELPEIIDGGQQGLLEEIDRGWDEIELNLYADVPAGETPPAAKAEWKNNPFVLAQNEIDEIDTGWDMTEDVITLSKEDIIPAESEEEVITLTEADIISCDSPEEIMMLTREDILEELEEIETLSDEDIISV